MQEYQPSDTVNHRYKVLRKLGAGAMGSVYLCEDSAENNIKVALKVLVSENLDDQDVWAKGEYEALTRLRHPNLAKVYNFGRIEGTRDYFIVSEFIKGIDLYSATEYLKYDEIIDIVVQICRALEYIHSQGYVHFDVKPDNILVSRQKTIGIKEGSKVQYEESDLQKSRQGLYDKPMVKLIDFGLAEKITGSFSFAIKGTLNYLAPEILNGTTPDKRADLYSLGVTIYQVVNRDLPFYQDFRPFTKPTAQFDNRAELFEANMKKHPEYLRELIMRLLEESPEERFQSAKEVIQFINRESEQTFELETEETRASYFHSPRLVGRKKEMNLLKQYHDLIFARDGGRSSVVEEDASKAQESSDAATTMALAHCIIVGGEMGSGKSRLLEEFQHYLKLNDIHIFRGNCYEGNQTAYQPIVEVLRQLVCSIEQRSEIFRRYEEFILKLLPEVAAKKEFGRRYASSSPEKEKQRFIDRITQFMVEVAETSPYVICINNLHWVDDASVDLLEKLFERIQETRRRGGHIKILVLASQRAEEQRGERVKELIEASKGNNFCIEMQVRRLKRPQIQEFLQSMLGITDVPDDFVSQLEEQTGGNPLFLIETLKALEDEGIVKHVGDGWSIKTTKYSRVQIPHRMEDLLQKRLGKLEDAKRQILEVLAILDKPVSPKFLQRFKRFAQLPILVHLRELEDTGIVRKLFENGKLQFEIEQPKVREILYADLDEELCRTYHGEVGEAFEEEYSHREEEILEELAYHYQRSDRSERAVQLALRAGDRLKAIYANERAREYFHYVLEEVADNPEYVDLYFQVREKLGDICTTMGDYDAAEEHYSALLMDDTREMLPPELVTNLYLQLGKVSEIQGDYEKALHRFKEARNYLSTSGRESQVLERARVYNSIGWIYVCMGKYEKAMTISLEALRVIESAPESIEHAMVYSTIGSANYFKGNIKDAVKYHRKSLQIKENLEDISAIIVSLNNLGEAHIAGSEYGDAAEHFRRALSTSDELGDPFGRALTLHNLAHLYCAVGRLEEATECLEESIEHSKAYKMRYLSLQNYIVRGMVLFEQKEYTKAEGNFFRVLTAFSKQGNRAGLCSILLKMVAVHRMNGNREEAVSMVEEARRHAESLDIQPLKARACLEEARLHRTANPPRYDRCIALLEEGLLVGAKVDNPELLGELNFELAETLVNVREVNKAGQYYAAAKERFREVLESLPDEFRPSYELRQAVRFPDWSSSARLSVPRKPPESAPLPHGGELPAGMPNVEEALRRVTELMQQLPSAASLKEFLSRLLENILESTAAELGYILSLSGRNLSVIAAHHRSPDAQPPAAGKILCLGLVDNALKSHQPIIVEQVWREPDIAAQLEDAPVDCKSLGIFPFLEPDGKKGVLYLVNAGIFQEAENNGLLLIQPFLNLVPVSYLHFQSQVAAG